MNQSRQHKPFETYSEFDEADFWTTDSDQSWEGETPGTVTIKDDFIAWVQQSLNTVQNGRLTVNGDIGGQGSATRKAIQSFQRGKSLPLITNGPVCPDTETVLRAAVGGGFKLKTVPGPEPAGLTFYVNIPLQVPLGDAKAMTGIFIPEKYCALPEVDLIVFLHGFKLRSHHPTFSIDTYWTLPKFRLRDEVNASGKNVILVAPTLGPQNQEGSLTCSGGFDRFLERVVEALKLRGPYASQSVTPTIRNIILACHSGSGNVMRAIAMGKDASVAKIQELWAFEPSSMGNAAIWKTWAAPPQKAKLFIYFRSGNPGEALCKGLKVGSMPTSGPVVCTTNITAERTTVDHDEVPMRLLRARIVAAPSLVAKSTCARKKSPTVPFLRKGAPRAGEVPLNLFHSMQPRSSSSRSDFEWTNRGDGFETSEEEAYETISLSPVSHEFETTRPAVPSPKTIALFNTDLNAPYFGGNFNFRYNGGSNEAWVTYNTYFAYTKSFPDDRKKKLLDNLKDAIAIWDGCAEVQVRDVAGNYNDRIRLRFKLNIVTDRKNANKRTEVHPDGSRSVFFIDKDRETVMRDLNIFIGSSRNVLVHELGHVWGLKDEYKDRWISMKLSLGHVGPNSPLINDTNSIMNTGYERDTGEFRTRYFSHFGRAILGAFWGLKQYMIPVRFGGKVVAHNVIGRIALRKRDIAGNAPYTADRAPFNTLHTGIQIAKRT